MANANSSNASGLAARSNPSSSGSKNVPTAPDSIASRVTRYPRSTRKKAYQAVPPTVPSTRANAASSASPIASSPLLSENSQWQSSHLPSTPKLSPMSESDHKLNISSTIPYLNLDDQVTTGDSSVDTDWVEAGLPSPSPNNPVVSNPPPNPGTWIHPYGLAADAEVPRVDSRRVKHPNNTQCLANSGITQTTRYPVSTSPRNSVHEIHATLDVLAHTERRARVGGKLVGSPQPTFRHVIDTSKMQFVPFSYDATFQPRTAAAREKEGEPVSPKTIPMGSELSEKEREELAKMFVLDDSEG